jgi:hypothetical protein
MVQIEKKRGGVYHADSKFNLWSPQYKIDKKRPSSRAAFFFDKTCQPNSTGPHPFNFLFSTRVDKTSANMAKVSMQKGSQLIKFTYSSIVLVFCLAIIMGAVFTRQTELSHDAQPWIALIVLIVSIAWLTMVEGGQGAIVGLGPVNYDLYRDTHPNSLKCTSLVHKGDNLDRYLLGRQFMVILIVYAVEMAGAATHYESLWGLPNWLANIFLSSGLAMILFTCMVGQLNSEVNGCHCMLDYSKC